MMDNYLSENAIRGGCPFFACRCCRTKYGREHQGWCEVFFLTEPCCPDCHYYSSGTGSCIHPAMKNGRKDLPRDENQHPLRIGQNA